MHERREQAVGQARDGVPVYKVTVVGRDIPAINYFHRSHPTKIGFNGTLLIVGAAESLQVSPLSLLMGCRSVQGWYSGTSIDSQDTLAFSARTGVRPMNENYPLDRVAEAYDRMMSGWARFRVVLTIGA